MQLQLPPQKKHGAIGWIKQIFRFISKIDGKSNEASPKQVWSWEI